MFFCFGHIWEAQNLPRSRFLTDNFCFCARSNRPKIIFAPGKGLHIIWYKRRFICMQRGESAERDHVFRLGHVVHSNDSSSDSIKLWAPGRSGARERLESFIADAMLYAISKDKEKTIVYSFVHSSHWVRTHSRAKRSLQSVILPAEMVEDFKNDIGSFFGRSELYEGLGIPYRRSYLLHGPVRIQSDIFLSTFHSITQSPCISAAWMRKDKFRYCSCRRVWIACLRSQSRRRQPVGQQSQLGNAFCPG